MTTAASKPGSRTRAKSDSRATPAMRQYRRFKTEHPDCVLFFRMGDFYEMFDDDAVLCHKALGIALTERTKGIPMAGVPYHAVESYLRRMIELGHRVAVCEQIEDPKEAKGVVERAVARVITPGTLVDETLLDESTANLVAAICFTEPGDHSAAVLALAELSTGAFTLHDLDADGLVDEVARLAPSEVLYVETGDGTAPPRVERMRAATGTALTPRPAWTFRLNEARDTLREHFAVATLNGFGLADDDPALAPAGALVHYLRETQSGAAAACASDQSQILVHLHPPRREERGGYVAIDTTSVRALEIERTMRSGQVEGSLLGVLQRCRTPMGKRLLRRWLCFPLRDRERIERRQRAVGGLVDDRAFADALTEDLSGVQDVARIVGRIAVRRATPRDLVALGRSVARITGLLELLDGRPAFASVFDTLRALADSILPLADRIGTMCVDGPPAHLREGGLFRDGVDQQLDEARTLQRDGSAFLARYQKDLIVETKIPSLKVGYNRVFGYYIEVTHAHARKVPAAFARKQTLKNAERYITPKLKDYEEKITTAQARAIEREQTLFARLCAEAAERAADLSGFADLVATLDVLACFADHATRHAYVRPNMVEEPILDIREGRHPVLDRVLTHQFVPNDCTLGLKNNEPVSDVTEAERDEDREETEQELPAARATLALITGPNMAGKSTYIRQTALIALLAHTGSFVPARSATIGLVDRIFTRIGASDELHLGQSTFMVEMIETSNILHHATEQSLVILDEIGRGTSTLDGLALAWAIAETLSDVGCRTLFATHYHELTGLADDRERVRNLHVSVREWGEEIVFLYRILPGRTDRSYGIHVAKLAGLPTATLDRAKGLLENLVVMSEREFADHIAKRPAPSAQLGLFTEYVEHPAVERLRTLDLDSMTPLEAFDALRQLHDAARGSD